ncbi:MAG: hypothetical protein WC089_01610 [Candidatus Paceibacterota bacterium]
MDDIKQNTLFNELSTIFVILIFIVIFPFIKKTEQEKILNKSSIETQPNYWPNSVDSLKIPMPFKSKAYIRGGPDDSDVYISRPKLVGGRICISTWGAVFRKGEIIKEKFIEDTCAKDSFTYIFKKKRLGDYPYVCVRYFFYDNNDTLLCTKQIVAH